MIEIENVTYQIANRKVLADISVGMEVGGFHAILGPNGAGKTSLLHMLAGDIKPVRGDFLLQGRSIGEYSITELASLRSVLPQENHFTFSMTVEEVCSLGRTPCSGDDAVHRSAIEKSLEAMDLLELRSKQFTDLSGGEKQRLHIARTLCQEAKIILLDEPTNSLDIKHQIQLMNLLQRLALDKKLVVIVTHDLNMALRYASHITLLRDGEVVSSRKVEDICKADDFTRTFDLDFILSNDESSSRPQLLPKYS